MPPVSVNHSWPRRVTRSISRVPLVRWRFASMWLWSAQTFTGKRALRLKRWMYHVIFGASSTDGAVIVHSGQVRRIAL